MAYAKIISTGFGVTIATLHAGSFAQNLTQNEHEGMPYTGNVVTIPSSQIKAIDLYQIVHPSISNLDESKINIYRQNDDGKKVLIERNGVIDVNLLSSNFSSILYFENTQITKDHGAIRIGALISGGPDGIIASSLMKEAGDLENQIIEGYDFFYIKSGRPSDWQEYNSINQFLQNNFDDNSFDLHIIDMSPQNTRVVLCGESESTYTRFGLSVALSLVSAECEKMNKKLDVILFGIHGADARFKARESNEYTRHFINSWNQFWKSFYPSAPLIIAPLIDVFDKIDILKMSKTLGVNIKNTWSCYLGGENHCGECKSCLERRLAYKISELIDPTEYSNTVENSKLQPYIKGVSLTNKTNLYRIS